MTVKTKLEVRRSEIRKRLAEISAAKDPAPVDELNGLTAEYTDVESKLTALAISEDEDGAPSIPTDAEAREILGLESRAKVSRYVERAAHGAALDGAEKELNAALKIPGDGAEVRLPLSMLAEDRAEDRETEDRADVVTSLNVDTVRRPEKWLPRVFIGTASEHLGINRKAVSGVAAFPVVTGGATAETVAKGAAKDSQAFNLSVTELKPNRISARYVFAKEDAARLGPAVFEDTMRADLRMSMTTAMDKEIIQGAGTHFNGLAGLTASPDAALDSATGALPYANSLLGLIDGKYAMAGRDIRYITRHDFYTYLLTLQWTIGENGTTAYHFLNYFEKQFEVMGKASAHIPEISGAAGESYVYACLARGKEGAAIHAVWDSVELIRDPFTSASKGEVALTAVALHNFEIIRSDNFKKIRVAKS